MSLFKFEKNQLFSLLISILIFVILALIYTRTTLFDGLERGAVNFRFFLRDPSERAKMIQEGVLMTKKNPKARDDIIILGIDLNTIRSMGQMGIEWPFPWKVHTKFTKYVGSGKPLAMLLDIMFLDHKPYEKELAEAIKKAGVVFIDYPFEHEEKNVKPNDLKERTDVLDTYRIPIKEADNSPQWVEEVEPPTPTIAKAARGLGFANIQQDPDFVVRRIPLVLKFNGYYYPSINLLLVMHFYGIGKDNLEIKMGEYIKLKNVPPGKMTKPNKERELTIPIDKQGFMDINYIGGHQSYLWYPYYYFHRDGTITNKSLENKIILVAAYTSTGIARDIYKSPYGDLFGIEHYANALNTILNQDFIIKLNDWQNVLILLAIALIFGLLIPRMSIVVSVIFTGIAALGYMVGAYILFDTMNLICVYSTPLMQIATTFSGITTYKVLTEQKENKFIKQTFSKFVSKSVVDELLKHPEKLKLGGEKKNLTVLFSDIRGFTTISEKVTPEALVNHLNEYLQEMTDIVIVYDGTLDKYVGDEIMAFWGAPIPQEDHALRACKAAVEMMAKLHKLNKKWKELKKPELNIGIGLNSGDMVVGNMGSSSRMDYTLMGDNVNLGARLEGINKVYKTNIIISESTYAMVKEHIIARELDLIKVIGKESPVKIYELIDIRDAAPTGM